MREKPSFLSPPEANTTHLRHLSSRSKIKHMKAFWKKHRKALIVVFFLVLASKPPIGPPPQDLENPDVRPVSPEKWGTFRYVSWFYKKLRKELPSQPENNEADAPKVAVTDHPSSTTSLADAEIEAMRTVLRSPSSVHDLHNKSEISTKVAQMNAEQIPREMTELAIVELMSPPAELPPYSTEEERLNAFYLRADIVLKMHETLMKTARNEEEAQQLTLKAADNQQNSTLKNELQEQLKKYFPAVATRN